VELFGFAHFAPLAVACLVAFLCSGRRGIYHAQRRALPKWIPSRRGSAPAGS
jgi:hypothetical protein